MRRRKRLTIIRIGLALAIAAIFPVSALAKGTPVDSRSVHTPYVTGQPQQEIPYLSHGQGVTEAELGIASAQVEIPYLSHGQGVTAAELGIATSNSPDDRAFTRSPVEQAPPVASDDGIEVNPYAVTGFGLAALLMAGMGLAVWHRRSTKLATA